jgi:hypothetical protein
MDERINDAMRDPRSILGGEKGNVTMYCPHGKMVGYVRKEDAAEFVSKGWAYVLTTSDCVEYKGCTCDMDNRDSYPADLIAF